MGRILGVTILVGGIFLMLNREKISEFKRNTIEAINPAVKEKRLIGEIRDNIDRLDAWLASPPSNSFPNIASVINQTKQTLSELQQTNEKLDLGANLSHLIQKVLPLAEKPAPTWSPPVKGCDGN